MWLVTRVTVPHGHIISNMVLCRMYFCIYAVNHKASRPQGTQKKKKQNGCWKFIPHCCGHWTPTNCALDDCHFFYPQWSMQSLVLVFVVSLTMLLFSQVWFWRNKKWQCLGLQELEIKLDTMKRSAIFFLRYLESWLWLKGLHMYQSLFAVTLQHMPPFFELIGMRLDKGKFQHVSSCASFSMFPAVPVLAPLQQNCLQVSRNALHAVVVSALCTMDLPQLSGSPGTPPVPLLKWRWKHEQQRDWRRRPGCWRSWRETLLVLGRSKIELRIDSYFL